MGFFRYTVLILVYLHFANASTANLQNRIIEGKSTYDREFPFVVSFRWHNVHHCAGSLLSYKHVLTAAHCVINGTSDLSQYSVHVGSNKLTNLLRVNVESIKVHEKYIGKSDWWKNDIAILKLKGQTPEMLLTPAKPIRIRKTAIDEFEAVTAIGWGFTTYPSNVLPTVQQKLETRALSFEKCKEFWSSIDPSQLCFWKGKGGGSICMDDSGGPLVSELGTQLVGILSWTTTYCTDDKPSVATRLAPHFLDWIEENTFEDIYAPE